jgi:Domain of unknown function (DUF5666)
MKLRSFWLIAAALALSAAAPAQDSGSTPPAGQNAGQGANQGGGYGRRGGGFGGGQGGEGRMGRGTIGTVTEVAADHYTIKTETGDVYTVHFDANTRIVKQPAGMGMRGQGGGQGGGQPGGGGGGQGMGGGYGRGNPPEQIKASDIKVGDMIRAAGEADATAKTISATAVMQLDPATVQAMREMQANFGKTWLQGKVTAIDGTKITLTGSMDSAPHTVVADENTTFRKRRDPVTLADIQVGDTIRAEGAVKDGVFTATAINVGGMMGGGSPNQQPGAPGSTPPQ